MGKPGGKALSGRAGEIDAQLIGRQTGVAIASGDFAREHRTDGAVDVADREIEHQRFAVFDGGLCRLDQLDVERCLEPVILRFGLVQHRMLVDVDAGEQARQIDAIGLPVTDGALHVDPVDAADHLVERGKAHFGHDLAQLFGDEEEVVDDVLGRADEALAQLRILGGDPHRAGVEMTLAHHDAARRDQRSGGKAELVSAQQRADGDVAAGPQPTVDLHRNAGAQVVEQQCLLGLGKADFPRGSRMRQAGQRRGAGAAFVAGDGHMVGARLGHARRNRADAHFGDQLDRDARRRIDVLQIVDQLRQILDRVDVMVRWRADQAHAGRRVAGLANNLVDLVAGQLAALTWLRALRHLDLHVVGIDQIFGRYAKAATGDLLDRGAQIAAVFHRLETARIFAAFAGVRLAADRVHGGGQRRMRFPADRAVAHRAGGEALDDLLGGFHLGNVERLVGWLQFHQPADRQQPF